MAEVVGGGTPSTKVAEHWGGDIPWVTPTEVTAREGGRILQTDRTITASGLQSSAARLLPEGAVLLTSRATIGAVALAGRELATNQGFASLIPGPEISSEFLMYWCQAHRAEFLARAGGNTFLEISKTNVKSIPIAIPELDEQRRIVDLVQTIDNVRNKLGTAVDAAGLAVGRHLDTLQAEGSRPLGMIVTMRAGASWKSEQETELAVDGATPVISIANTKPDGRLDVTTRRYVAGLPPGTRRLTDSSVIMIRTNGNRQRIGNVYRVSSEAVGSAVSAFQIAMDAVDPSDAPFVYWLLSSPRIQASISASASGTTGLGNIAVGWLRELDLPWPEESARGQYVALAESLDAVRRALEDELRAADSLRWSALSELLAEQYRLPAGYDSLLGI